MVFKKNTEEKLKFKWIAHQTTAENLRVWNWHMAIVFHFSPSTDILWNLLPYPSTDFPLYSQQQKRNLQSMRNYLRQLPALTFSMTLTGILRGWDLTIERNEELHLWQSIRALFLSVSATIFCENFVTIVGDMHGRLARWRKWRACHVGEAKEGLKNELWRRWSNGRVGEWVVT